MTNAATIMDQDSFAQTSQTKKLLIRIRNLCAASAAGILLANGITFFIAPELLKIGAPGIEITKAELFIPGFSSMRLYSEESGISGRFAQNVFDPEPDYRFKVEGGDGLQEMITLPQNGGARDSSVITFYLDGQTDPLAKAFEGWRRPDPRYFDTAGIERFGWREVPGQGRRLELYLEPNQPQSVDWVMSWIYKSLTGQSDLIRDRFVREVVADTNQILPKRDGYSVILAEQRVDGPSAIEQSVTAIPTPDNYNIDGFWWMMF